MRLSLSDPTTPGLYAPAVDHGQLAVLAIDDATGSFLCFICASGLVLHLTVAEVKLLVTELATKVKGLTVEGL